MNSPAANDGRTKVSPATPVDAVIDAALLDLLLTAQDPIRIESLVIQRGVTASQILQELERLRRAGCQIEVHPQHGVRLTVSGLTSWTDYLRWSNDRANQRIIEVYAQTTSTQDAARRLVSCCGSAADRAIVIADLQTVGRGRLGRRWIAPPGTAVTFTRVCLLEPMAASVDHLTLATTVALADTIESLVPTAQVQIKWPNDLLVNGLKVAGILVETFRVSDADSRIAALVGVGINVMSQPHDLPGDCRDRATSLFMAGSSIDRLRVLNDAVRTMDETLEQHDAAALLQKWRRRCPMLTQRVRLRSGDRMLCGQVIDLDPKEGLIVRTDAGVMVHLPAATATIL